jgi:hypothetical protein
MSRKSVSRMSVLRGTKTALLAAVVALSLSGLALARDGDGDRDRDDGYYRGRGNPAQARQYGYQSGYRDGYGHGREEGRERDPRDFRSEDWERANRGYQNWMGPYGQFRNGYRDGYRNGFQAGYRSLGWGGRRGDGDGDADDRYRRRWPAVNGGGYLNDLAHRFGYEDGCALAREDWERRRNYHLDPHDRFGGRDHGYDKNYGDKRLYKDQYTEAFRQGYGNTWNGLQGNNRQRVWR